MRLFLIFLVASFISCSDSAAPNNKATDTVQHGAALHSKFGRDLIVDTPKILVAGRDYITIATSPSDKLYFGEKFSPYKLEPYDIADIEQVIDSTISSLNKKGVLKGKSLTDFKYQIYSAKTSGQKLQVRVQAICSEKASLKNWSHRRINIADGGKCYFSLLYDLTDKKLLQMEVDNEG